MFWGILVRARDVLGDAGDCRCVRVLVINTEQGTRQQKGMPQNIKSKKIYASL